MIARKVDDSKAASSSAKSAKAAYDASVDADKKNRSLDSKFATKRAKRDLEVAIANADKLKADADKAKAPAPAPKPKPVAKKAAKGRG